jgi:hypothetical protein
MDNKAAMTSPVFAMPKNSNKEPFQFQKNFKVLVEVTCNEGCDDDCAHNQSMINEESLTFRMCQSIPFHKMLLVSMAPTKNLKTNFQ